MKYDPIDAVLYAAMREQRRWGDSPQPFIDAPGEPDLNEDKTTPPNPSRIAQVLAKIREFLNEKKEVEDNLS
jgi:hypothetical protein